MDILIEKELSKTGVEVVKVNGLYLHSKYNPLREAEQKLAEEYKPHHLHVVFGYGLGYLVDRLIEKFQFNEPILVIDPLVDSGALKLIDPSYNRFYYAEMSNISKIVSFIDQLSSYSTNVHYIVSMNYDKLFPEQLKTLLELVKNNHYKQGSNIATAKHFAMPWQRNLLYNTPNLVSDLSLNALEKKYDVPIVVAAGGPSLTKQLPLVKEYRDKIILICAGSTINALLLHNIIPDYIVSVDGGEPNARHFNELKFDSNVSLIYGSTNHPVVRKSFSGNCYGFIPSVKPKYAQYFESRFSKQLPLIDGGGSVAHYALTIARFISSGPIALIGQDLALTNNQTHADGNKGKHGIEHIPKKKQLLVEGYYGGQVITTQTMSIMLNSFNEPPLIHLNRNNIWNCTEGGAKIRTIAQMPFGKYLEEFASSIVSKIELENTKNKQINLTDFLQDEIRNYKKIIKLLNEGLVILNKPRGRHLQSGEITKIGKIEKELNKLYKKYSLETLLEPIFDRCSHEYLPQIGETEVQATIRAKNYALDLYTSCFEELNKFIALIDEMGKS